MRALLLPLLLALVAPLDAAAGDWAGWRGPTQDGVSAETGVIEGLDLSKPAWVAPIRGRSSPVVHDGAVYVWGYAGEGAALTEELAKLDAATGEVLWRRGFRDFLSDIIYDRYSIGAPVVDPATGHVYVHSSAGLLLAFDADGALLWRVSLAEGFGRLSFPNGRTGAPVIDDERVIVHFITSNWGGEGPARDRFYAFDKADGKLLWSSTPGLAPKDSSFSTPVLVDEADGRRTLLAGTGCGHVVAVDARTGAPRWRSPLSLGGVNTSPVVIGRRLFITHDRENLDNTEIGRMVALDLDGPRSAGEGGVDTLSGELWRAPLASLSSSPVAVGALVLQVTMTGELVALRQDTGAEAWRLALGPDQLHASPVALEGHVLVPLQDGSLHLVRVTEAAGEVVQRVQLDGALLGAPAVSDGRVVVVSTKGTYAFGAHKPSPTVASGLALPAPAGAPVAVRVRPAEVLLRPGEAVAVRAELLDAAGRVVDTVAPDRVTPWVPPTAKVRSEMRASWAGGQLVAPADAGLSAGAFQVTAKGLTGTFRGRTVAPQGYAEGFDGLALDGPEGAWGWPPLAWIGARFKWVVAPDPGGEGQVLRKTLDRVLFQRSTVFVGHPADRDYRLSARVMTDGNRRQRGAVGLVHQRYLVALKGNQGVLEVSSNHDRLKVSVPFTMEPGVWYRLVSEVRLDAEGTAHVRAKAWAEGAPEPDAWTLEVAHPSGHAEGAPGFWGLTPNNLHAVYLDDFALDALPAEAP